MNQEQYNKMMKAQEEFNNKIIEIANKIFLIRQYSYSRRGLKFDSQKPDKMLSVYEQEGIDALHNQMKAVVKAFQK